MITDQYLHPSLLSFFFQGNEERTIQQFQFNAWSDQKTPSYISSLVLFYHKVVNTVDYNNGPMLVHCRFVYFRETTNSFVMI